MAMRALTRGLKCRAVRAAAAAAPVLAQGFRRFGASASGDGGSGDERRTELAKVPAVVWSAGATKVPPPSDGNYQPGSNKYVDKTAVLHDVLSHGARCLFVTAPRRMGKSTMLSMLAHMAVGNWEAFPPGAPRWTKDASDVRVIRLDLSDIDWPEECDASAAEYAAVLRMFIAGQALWQHGIDVAALAGSHPLAAWIQSLVHTGKRVVVLVDEYDKEVVNMALDDVGNHRGLKRAEEFVKVGLKPFFEATKDKGADKVIMAGVSNFALNAIGSGANHFRHAFHVNPEFTRAVGYTPDELRETYGDAVLERFRLACEGAASATATLSAAVDYVKRHGNGWCLEGTAAIELLSPYAVNTWLHDPGQVEYITDIWARSGTPTALVSLLRAHAALLLGHRRVPWSSLTAELAFDEYFSAANVDQLGFHFGYLSIEVGSREADAVGVERAPTGAQAERRKDDDPRMKQPFSVVLRPPNAGVTNQISAQVASSKFMDMTVASDIKLSLIHHDWEKLRAAITRLSQEFMRHNERPFANERELHMLASAWATMPRDNEVRQELRATEGRHSNGFVSFVSWQPADADANAGCFHGILIEWGLTNEQRSLKTLVAQKVKQIEDREYVKRVAEFHTRQTQRHIEVVTAIAVVGRVVVPKRSASGEWKHTYAVEEVGSYSGVAALEGKVG